MLLDVQHLWKWSMIDICPECCSIKSGCTLGGSSRKRYIQKTDHHCLRANNCVGISFSAKTYSLVLGWCLYECYICKLLHYTFIFWVPLCVLPFTIKNKYKGLCVFKFFLPHVFAKWNREKIHVSLGRKTLALRTPVLRCKSSQAV